jgi:hypothetical protein
MCKQKNQTNKNQTNKKNYLLLLLLLLGRGARGGGAHEEEVEEEECGREEGSHVGLITKNVTSHGSSHDGEQGNSSDPRV